MNRSRSVSLAGAVAVIAVIAPVAFSVYLAFRESVSDEKLRAHSYAAEMLRRGDEVASQLGRAFEMLRAGHYPPCSAQELDLMRQLDMGSSYIQVVGRVENNSLVCTSQGTPRPLDVGPVEIVSANGVEERLNRKLSGVSSDRMDIFSQDGFAAIVDLSLIIDIPSEGDAVRAAAFVPSSPQHTLVLSHGSVPAKFLVPLDKGETRNFVEDGEIVSAIRSSDLDLEVVVLIPRSYADNKVERFALSRVPLALFGGVLLAWAVLYLSRAYFSMSHVLRGAARRHEFFVHYQPVVELETRRWVGAEALVRWKRRGRVVPPDQFIPVAEESEVITAITAEVMAMAGRDLRKLLEVDKDFEIAVNLSAADMRSVKTLDGLKRMLADSGGAVRNIVVEATERGFLQGEESKRVLDAIRQHGFSISIDDFGTGYSSLSALQSLSLDTLKIDKTFVETIGTDGATSGVVVHIIEMAKSMGLQMVAEGVETEAQAEFLRGRGVQYAQGWLFGRPMALDDLKSKLRDRHRLGTPPPELRG